jgi:hypothetical protein
MSLLFANNHTMHRASLLLPVLCTLLLIAVAPRHAHSSTYAVVALMLGLAIVVWTTWRHGQPVASLRQELYDINHQASRDVGSSWQRWVAAGDVSNARGRSLAAFGLSAAISAVIVFAWFA